MRLDVLSVEIPDDGGLVDAVDRHLDRARVRPRVVDPFLLQMDRRPDRALLDVTGDIGQPEVHEPTARRGEGEGEGDREQDQAEPVAAQPGHESPKVASGTLIGPSVPAHVSMVA